MASTGKTVLVVDDAPSIRAMVGKYLEGEGYRVVSADNGRTALERVRSLEPDLVILDIMMPEMDGLAFVTELRRERATPVIMLTAKVDESDRVVGLELGADDYITKPFGLRELAARVRAVMRRAANEAPRDLLRVGGIAMDRTGRSVTVDGAPVDLTPSEFRLLETLMLEPGKAFARVELLEALQGNMHDAYERTIDVHVRNLRAKIEPDAARPRYVVTVWGAGYRLEAGGE
jgi:DNA-binding response OmpR family regulator